MTQPGIRARLVALAAVLITLWSYAAYLTGQDTADLLRVRALAETLGQPIDRLVLGLQTERRLTVETIAGAGSADTALVGAREGTDRAAAEVRVFTEGHDLRLLTADAVRDRADELVRRLNGLGTIRSQVDAGQLDRARVVDGYDQLVDVAFAVYGPEWGAYESDLAADTRTVIALARARELLAREDTLVSAALAGARFDLAERRRLTTLVSNQRYARGEAVAALPGERQRLAAGPPFTDLLALEDALSRTDTANTVGGITQEGWRKAVDGVLGALHELVTAAARDSVQRATPGAAGLVVRTGAVLGLGLIAVLAVLLSWAGLLRRLTRGAGPLPRRPVGAAPGAAADR
ncbi:nitrate- and nitrite sensing domain-containing protein [Micromonospora sp. STR1_7]|uniref:Nitrate- and nitrite sensing domain-containing protein n=1 Tax=Micromonospora parastrephiae TaxID=2806101 RepID=A0ABS1XNE0_9ACTN|nr:nitrate- and nitrite sensing domain-containing protein [Micromonospora parastrephiae]MBM0230772.1 nitrate- and nitrite sensing domain-containing protein [Micromonospora parastrephiae]